MRVSFCTNHDVAGVTGCAVVIDVLRAFTTAAVALAAGAGPYELVSGLDDAGARRRADPGVELIGEVDGIMAPGFDHSNSPTRLAAVAHRLRGVPMVHRSSAGTQGVIRAARASRILVASFAVAGATARALAGEQDVTFVVTGRHGVRDGDEDLACGEYIAALLAGGPVDPAPYVARVATSTAAGFFDGTHADLPPEDVPFAQVVDRVDFAMEVDRRDGRHLLRQLRGGASRSRPCP